MKSNLLLSITLIGGAWLTLFAADVEDNISTGEAVITKNIISTSDTSDDTSENEEQEAYSGDVYRISEDKLDGALSYLESIGGRVLFHRDDLYLLIYPEDKFDSSAISSSHRLRGVKGKKPSLLPPLRIPGRKNIPTMDVARLAFNANFIHEGVSLPMPMDGSGVVVGMSDCGFDPNHSNFLKIGSSESRVRKVADYQISKGIIETASTPEEIASWTTDDDTETHATHVAGIMAGRGGGGKYMGMAPGADIVGTTSDLYDVGILAGVEEIIAYAKNAGLPAVVNLSVGSYGGPHDGTSLFCQYLDKCAEDAVICISTGNEGAHGNVPDYSDPWANHIGYQFGDDPSDRVIFSIGDTAWTYFDISASDDIYSADDTPISIGIFIRDTAQSGSPIVYETPMIDLSEIPEWVITSDPEKAAEDSRFHYDEEFAKYFEGEIYFMGGIDPENGRFLGRLYIRTKTEPMVSETKKWARYQIGGYVEGDPGQKIDMYADGVRSRFRTKLWGVRPNPDHDMSISDLATGKNVISVGAYWTRESLDLQSGDKLQGEAPMTVAKFTSYGTLADGRVTPMTVAPGAPIISSHSGHYMNRYPTFTEYISEYEHEGYYWGVNSGTSMATPYVVGCIATWLQACPTLTPTEVRNIVLESNNTEDYPLSADPRHGLGFFDPYKGMRMIVERSLTNVESMFNQSLFVSYNSGSLKIENPDSRSVSINVYSADGIKLASISDQNLSKFIIDEETLGLTGFRGIAICKVTAPGASPAIVKIAR